jgi:hypothetical protein
MIHHLLRFRDDLKRIFMSLTILRPGSVQYDVMMNEPPEKMQKLESFAVPVASVQGNCGKTQERNGGLNG